jgi:hypothetical protein
MTHFDDIVRDYSIAKPKCPCGDVIAGARPVCPVCWRCAPHELRMQYEFHNRRVATAHLKNFASMRKTLNKPQVVTP